MKDDYILYTNDVGYSLYKRCSVEGEEDSERPIITHSANPNIHSKDRLQKYQTQAMAIPESLKFRVGLIQLFKDLQEEEDPKAKTAYEALQAYTENNNSMTEKNIVLLLTQHYTKHGEYLAEELEEFVQWCYDEIQEKVELRKVLNDMEGQKELDYFSREEE